MKFIFDKASQIYSSKGQTRVIPGSRRGLMLMLIFLIIVLSACSRPQQATSGVKSGGGGARATGTPGTPTPSGNTGGAVLNLERSALFHSGDDFQREVGTIQLKFSETTEGHLVVEGTGKTVWTEDSKIANCSYKVKTEGTVTVTGIYNVDYCKFELRIHVKLPPSATSYDNSGVCGGTIVFNNRESSSQIELSKPYTSSKEIKQDGWWQTSTVKMTDIKSDEVTGCLVFLTPEVIE